MRLVVAGAFTFLCANSIAASQVSEKSTTPSSPPSGATRPSSNPIPDKFVNLQVLPKDIGKPQLIAVMKQFAVTFSVRCSYCHTVSDDLTRGSFESDEKEPKGKARELLKLIYNLKTTDITNRPDGGH